MRLDSLESTRDWARAVVSKFTRPCIILLDGELGAGKTQLVRYFLQALGVEDVSSPTFSIHNEYRSIDGAIDHVDLYRVRSDADLEATGFWDLVVRPKRLLFVEWAKRLPADVWPSDGLIARIQLRKVEGDENAREVEFSLRPPEPTMGPPS